MHNQTLRRLALGIRTVAHELFATVFPCRCAVCGRRLTDGERHLCTACYMNLPFTRLRGERGNVVERLFWEKMPVVRANAFIRYIPGSDSSRVVRRLKYGDRPGIGLYFGRAMAHELRDTDFFEGIDMIVPVPLHRHKQRRRGYNQSELLAAGLAEVTGLPVRTDLVERVRDTETQTKKTHAERRRNMEGAFRLIDAAAAAGRHILLVDDVITTNATLLACGQALAQAADVRISVIALSMAGRHTLVTKDSILTP